MNSDNIIGLILFVLISLLLIDSVYGLTMDNLRTITSQYTNLPDWIRSENQSGVNWQAENITANEYFKGQPLDGALDSGVIKADELDGDANVNLTHTDGTLNIAYPNMVVRLVTTAGVVKYCNIVGATVSVTDNQHSVYYIDNNCAVQSTTIANYIATDLSPGGITEIFNAMAHSGDIEVHQGSPIQSKVNIKLRKSSFNVANLRTVSGLGIITEGFSNFTIQAGEYIYINDVVDTTIQNMTFGSVFEVVYRDGGTWHYDEYEEETQTGLNLTSCDDGTDVVTCSNPSKYRRYLIFITGYDIDDDKTEMHQRLADEDTTYANIGGCLNTEVNPISFSLPDLYTYTAVPLYVYCGKAVDTIWTEHFIDLRVLQVGTAASDIDTSIFLTEDGTRPLTGNWDAGAFNITTTDSVNAYKFWGLYNWTTLSGFLSFTGSVLDFSSTILNNTIVSLIGDYPTGNTTAEINAVESDPQFDAKILLNRSEDVTFSGVLYADAVPTGIDILYSATIGSHLDVGDNLDVGGELEVVGTTNLSGNTRIEGDTVMKNLTVQSSVGGSDGIDLLNEDGGLRAWFHIPAGKKNRAELALTDGGNDAIFLSTEAGVDNFINARADSGQFCVGINSCSYDFNNYGTTNLSGNVTLDEHILFSDDDEGLKFYSGANELLNVKRVSAGSPTITSLEFPNAGYIYVGATPKMIFGATTYSYVNIRMPDNVQSIYGTGQEGRIYYNGTGFIINPRAVGYGDLWINSSVYSAGNVTADYFIGNGSQLTDLPAGAETDPQFDTKILANRTYNVVFGENITAQDLYLQSGYGMNIRTTNSGAKLCKVLIDTYVGDDANNKIIELSSDLSVSYDEVHIYQQANIEFTDDHLTDAWAVRDTYGIIREYGTPNAAISRLGTFADNGWQGFNDTHYNAVKLGAVGTNIAGTNDGGQTYRIIARQYCDVESLP